MKRLTTKARLLIQRKTKTKRLTARAIEFFDRNSKRWFVNAGMFERDDGSPGVRVGVYMNRQRHTALVIAIELKKTRFVSTLNNRLTCIAWGHERFKREFYLALPHYPLHQAAARYLNAHIRKTPASIAALESMLGK